MIAPRAMPAIVRRRLELPGSTARSTAPYASGYQASMFPNRMAIANGNTSGATQIAWIAVRTGSRSATVANLLAMYPSESVAAPPHRTRATPSGSHAANVIA